MKLILSIRWSVLCLTRSTKEVERALMPMCSLLNGLTLPGGRGLARLSAHMELC